jgi:hypothetical protein
MGIAHSALRGEQSSQARTPRKAAVAVDQCVLDLSPGIAGRLRDRSGVGARPFAGARVMGIGPGENLNYRKARARHARRPIDPVVLAQKLIE